MNSKIFIEEIKNAISGRLDNKPKLKKKIHKTPEEIYREEFGK